MYQLGMIDFEDLTKEEKDNTEYLIALCDWYEMNVANYVKTRTFILLTRRIKKNRVRDLCVEMDLAHKAMKCVENELSKEQWNTCCDNLRKLAGKDMCVIENERLTRLGRK